MAQSLNNLATLYCDQGLSEQAEPLFKQSLAIREKALGAQHPDTVSNLADYIKFLRKMNRAHEVAELMKEKIT